MTIVSARLHVIVIDVMRGAPNPGDESPLGTKRGIFKSLICQVLLDNLLNFICNARTMLS